MAHELCHVYIHLQGGEKLKPMVAEGKTESDNTSSGAGLCELFADLYLERAAGSVTQIAEPLRSSQIEYFRKVRAAVVLLPLC